MHTNLQKKILTSTALIFLFGVGLYTLYSGDKKVSSETKGKGEPKLLASQILTISNIQNPSEDGNNNGTPNWQESILGKDLTLQDVKNLPALDSSSTDISSEAMERLTDSKNLTTALVKNNLVVASYAKNISSSTDIDYSGLSDDVLAQTLSSYSFKTYTVSDLKNINKTPYQIDRKKYGNELAQKTSNVIKNYVLINEQLALKDLSNGKTDTKNVADLKKKIVGVTQFKDELLLMKVPSDAVTYHLGYINAVERYLEVLMAFYGVSEDPLKAALMLRGYKDIVQSQFKFLQDFEEYFSKNNLVFTRNDYGYMFTVGVGKK